MREIDNSGSEIFPMNEEVKGGKNHKKIVAGSLLAPVLAVAAAGLITLAAIVETGGNGTDWDPLPPPPYEEVLPPEDPVIPPEKPEDPEKKPEDPEDPEEKPEDPEKKPEEPTTPPPTTPPPTTPPPTTPPPTTPPPTTPPPTTPPYIYDPDPEPVVPPSFQAPKLTLQEYDAGPDWDLYVRFVYSIDPGDAALVTFNPYVEVPDDTEKYYSSGHPRSFSGSSSGEEGECVVPSPPPELRTVTLHLYAEYEQNGVTKTIDIQVTIPVYSGFTDPTVDLSGAWYIQSGQAIINLQSIADLGDADLVQLELVVSV